MSTSDRPILDSAIRQYYAARNEHRTLSEFLIHPKDYHALLREVAAHEFAASMFSYLNPGPMRLMSIPITVTEHIDPITRADVR